MHKRQKGHRSRLESIESISAKRSADEIKQFINYQTGFARKSSHEVILVVGLEIYDI